MFFTPGACFSAFLTPNSDSTRPNPPLGHPHIAGNRKCFKIDERLAKKIKAAVKSYYVLTPWPAPGGGGIN